MISLSLLTIIVRMYVLLYLTKKSMKSMIPGLRDFSFFLSITFVYELFLIKITKANIEKTQLFHKMKYDLKVQARSHKAFLFFALKSYCDFLFNLIMKLF